MFEVSEAPQIDLADVPGECLPATDSLTPSTMNSGKRIKRPIMRRSRLACVPCRARKVRCDIVLHGSSCSNCTWTQVQCIVAPSKRLRQVSMMINPLPSPPEEDSAHFWNLAEMPSHSYTGNLKDEREKNDASDFGLQAVDLALESLLTHKLVEPVSRTDTLQHHETVEPTALLDKWSMDSESRSQLFLTLDPQHLSHMVSSKRFAISSGHISDDLDFESFKFRADSLLSDDFVYLQKTGALAIPEYLLRKELLRSYATSVHPRYPILDLDNIVDIIFHGNQTPKKQMSLLLFQTIMFAGVSHASLDTLHMAGYASREVAQQVFYSRAKLLYNFDIEADCLTTLQSLLLMSSSDFTPSDGKGAWHWLGLAISLSYRIDLHQPQHVPAELGGTRRRIWWTCFVRDRVMALTSGTRSRIRKADCGIEMVRLQDFQSGVGTGAGTGMEKLHVGASVTALGEMFVEKAVICWNVPDEVTCPKLIINLEHHIDDDSTLTILD